jgi:hypothetical protein
MLTGNYTSFEQYRSLCRELGGTDEQGHEMLATALHCLGVALNTKTIRGSAKRTSSTDTGSHRESTRF